MGTIDTDLLEVILTPISRTDASLYTHLPDPPGQASVAGIGIRALVCLPPLGTGTSSVEIC